MVRLVELFFILIGFEKLLVLFYIKFMFIKLKDRDVICYVLVWDFIVNYDVRYI